MSKIKIGRMYKRLSSKYHQWVVPVKLTMNDKMVELVDVVTDKQLLYQRDHFLEVYRIQKHG